MRMEEALGESAIQTQILAPSTANGEITGQREGLQKVTQS